MNQGRIEQIDRPLDIYKNPRSRYVADFVGTSNFFEGDLSGSLLKGADFQFEVAPPAGRVSGPVTAAIRPEKIELLTGREAEAPAAGNLLSGHLLVVTFLGLMVRLVVRAGERELIVDFLEKRYEESGLHRGDSLRLYLPPEAFRVYPR
jgi:ABC-type Fe3+/spermidine/putrescine transport system ATPase subunit